MAGLRLSDTVDISASKALLDLIREAAHPLASVAADKLRSRPRANEKNPESPKEIGSFTALLDHAVGLLRNAASSRIDAVTTPDNNLRPVNGKDIYPGGMTFDDLRFLRGVYPDQDGLLDAHTMGRPSFAAAADMLEQFLHWQAEGVEGWGKFMKTKQDFRELVGELLGVESKAVLHGPNATDLHRMLLLPRKNPVIAYDKDHFSTIHKMMGGQEFEQDGGDSALMGKPNATKMDFTDPNFEVQPDTEVVLLSHAGYKTGKVLDVKAIVERIHSQAPKALVIIDAYQTAGTVPINVDELGENVVLIGGGHKQLSSAAGAGFAAFSKGTIEKLKVEYPGWWSEEDDYIMWKYQDGPSKPADPASANRLQGGSLDFFAQGRLCVELEIIKKLGGGSIEKAMEKIRGKSLHQLRYMRSLLEQLHTVDFECISPENDNALPSYLVYKHPRAKEIEGLLRVRGVCVDSRAEENDQFLRVSVNKATTDADLAQACLIIKEVVTHLPPKLSSAL